jgi:hypothetical protein
MEIDFQDLIYLENKSTYFTNQNWTQWRCGISILKKLKRVIWLDTLIRNI